MAEHPRRKFIRLPNYDYSQAGRYFITICTQKRIHYFGEIVGAALRGRPMFEHGRPMFEHGRPLVESDQLQGDYSVFVPPHTMVEQWLYELQNKYHGVTIDTHVIMPNHIHFIISKLGAIHKKQRIMH